MLGQWERALNQLNVAATLGSVLVFAGRMDEGWRTLEDAIARAAGSQHEAEAARGYRMLTSSASVLVEYDRAEFELYVALGRPPADVLARPVPIDASEPPPEK